MPMKGGNGSIGSVTFGFRSKAVDQDSREQATQRGDKRNEPKTMWTNMLDQCGVGFQ